MTESEAKYVAELEAANLDMSQKIQSLQNELGRPTRLNSADFTLYKALLNTFYVFCGTPELDPVVISNYLRLALSQRVCERKE